MFVWRVLDVVWGGLRCFLLQETRREDVGQVAGNKSMSVAMTLSRADAAPSTANTTTDCILFGLRREPLYTYQTLRHAF